MKDAKIERISYVEHPAFWKRWFPNGEYALYTALTNTLDTYLLDFKARYSLKIQIQKHDVRFFFF
jgi:hypothetical protein